MAGAIPSRGPVQCRTDGRMVRGDGTVEVWGLWRTTKDEPAETSAGSTCRFGRNSGERVMSLPWAALGLPWLDSRSLPLACLGKKTDTPKVLRAILM
jgi:hypothetical protein